MRAVLRGFSFAWKTSAYFFGSVFLILLLLAFVLDLLVKLGVIE